MTIPKDRARDKHQGAERRRDPRLPPSVIPAMKGARLLAGPEVQLINVSRGGALLETDARMMPGSSICIRLVAADAVFLLRGKVIRSRASALRGQVLMYESAVMFDEPFPVILNETAPQQDAAQDAAEALESKAAASLPEGTPAPAVESEPAALNVTANIPSSGPDLRQIFGLNSW